MWKIKRPWEDDYTAAIYEEEVIISNILCDYCAGIDETMMQDKDSKEKVYQRILEAIKEIKRKVGNIVGVGLLPIYCPTGEESYKIIITPTDNYCIQTNKDVHLILA